MATSHATPQPQNYELMFVGLVCFLNQDNGASKARLALLPDGTNPGLNVQKHFPYIVVNPGAVVQKSGWDTNDANLTALMNHGAFRLPKCTLQISGTENGANLDPMQHDLHVPKLIAADPTVKIDPNTPNAIAKLRISSGKLEALRRPNSNVTDTDVAVISRLTVSHTGDIVVTATPTEGGQQRTLRLKAGTPIALANVAFPSTNGTAPHFPIYGRITKSGTIANNPQKIPANTLPQAAGTQTIFQLGIQINDGTAACGNQGCCRP